MAADSTKSIYLARLFDVLQEREHPVRPLIDAAGLCDVDFADREQPLPIEKYLLCVEEALKRYRIPDLGFLVGEHTNPMEHGLLSYALLSSPNLRESLRRYVRYQYLQGPLLVVTFAEQGDMASMTAVPRDDQWPMSPAAVRYFVQEWLVGWNQWCRLIGRTGYFFEHVRLGYAAENEQPFYEDHLGCTVSIDNAATTAIFPARRLDLPLEYADASIAALCSAQCQWLLEVLNLRSALVAKIHTRLARIPGHMPTMNDIAGELHLDTRTLRRRLSKEGTTYTNIVLEFRVAMAKRYLAETLLPANEVASLVGYSDPANLYRIFQKATGLTPHAYRESVANCGLH